MRSSDFMALKNFSKLIDFEVLTMIALFILPFSVHYGVAPFVYIIANDPATFGFYCFLFSSSCYAYDCLDCVST